MDSVSDKGYYEDALTKVRNNGKERESKAFNPLRPTAIQKLLEIISRVRLYPSCSFATALDSGHKSDYRLR